MSKTKNKTIYGIATNAIENRIAQSVYDQEHKSISRFVVRDHKYVHGAVIGFCVEGVNAEGKTVEFVCAAIDRDRAEMIANLLTIQTRAQDNFPFAPESSAQWSPPKNALVTLTLYKHGAMWVFDDPTVNLSKEALVAGIPDILEDLLDEIKIARESAEQGVTLVFSPTPFPGYQRELIKTRSDMGGTWYSAPGSDGVTRDGWLCPALFKYHDSAPERIYAMVKEIKRATVTPPPVNDDPTDPPIARDAALTNRAIKRAKTHTPRDDNDAAEPRHVHTAADQAGFLAKLQEMQIKSITDHFDSGK